MIKKITLILILVSFMISCGKKSDPIYKGYIKEITIENIPIKIA